MRSQVIRGENKWEGGKRECHHPSSLSQTSQHTILEVKRHSFPLTTCKEVVQLRTNFFLKIVLITH